MPTCIALAVEFAPKEKGQIANAVTFSGYSVGGATAAVLAIGLLLDVDFRVLYPVWALPLITLLPIVYRYLPESISYLARTGRAEQARATEQRYGLVYGLNTWLPQIMRSAGFPLGSSLAFLLALNAGAIGASYVADRIGIQKVVTASFAIACVAIFLISLNWSAGVLFLLVAVAGLGSVGTQILVGGFCANHYPQELTATALAWSLGVGRIGAICGPLVGGVIVGLAASYEISFYFFAAVAVIGTAVVASVSWNPVANVTTRTNEASSGPPEPGEVAADDAGAEAVTENA